MRYWQKTPPQKYVQQGTIIMLLLLIILVGGMSFLATTQSSKQREHKNLISDLEKLQTAKQALIAYAAFQNEPNITLPGVEPAINNSPGELPCPDYNNDGKFLGYSDFTTVVDDDSNVVGTCKSYVGWLPFITLDIEELRDSSGNRFWYAVSDNYQTTKNEVLNSTTGTALTLNSNGINNPVVAVIIAPGEPINEFQAVRPKIDVLSASKDVFDLYLDFANADGDPTNAVQAGEDASSYFTIVNNLGPPDANDIVIGITAKEIWQHASTWPLQQARDDLKAYHVANGKLPFAKDDVNNCAAGGLTAGLLPVDNGLGNCVGANALLPPVWFTANAWDQVIFYRVSPNCAPGPCAAASGGLLLSGSPHEALVIDTGAPLEDTECSGLPPYDQADPRQALPLGSICDYLELNENTDLDDDYVYPLSNQLSNDLFLPIDI